MFLEYVDEALKLARFERIRDVEPFYGEIHGLRGVYATGKTLHDCKKNLRDVLEGWLLVRVRKNLPISFVAI